MEKETIVKWILGAIGGGIGAIRPTLPLAAILFFAIIMDCISAYGLNRRLKKLYPDKVDGKFKSNLGFNIFKTMFYAYGTIALLHLVEHAFKISINLAGIGTGVFCLIQITSVLENYSSASDAKWAKVLQKFIADKTKKHLDIDVAET